MLFILTTVSIIKRD